MPRRLIDRHPALCFTGLAYLLSWAIWIPTVRVFLSQPAPTITVPLLLGALVGSYGPTGAALIVAAVTEGREGVVALLRRFLRWRPIGLVVLGLTVPIVVFLLTQAATRTAGAGGGPLAWERLTLAALLGRVAFALPFGPLAEEAGWRGMLLPTLQARHSALVSSLLVAVAWTFWHLPMFWVPGAALPPEVAPGPTAIGLYFIGVSATSVIATALYNSSSGSLVVAVAYHLGTNLWHQVLSPVFVGDPELAWREQRGLGLIANWAVALGIVAWLGPANLSRRPRQTR
ncbi:MAG: lysostaphin resistance A-like protein [Gemmatimonadales bacterium]